jgi:hypothetical protein
LQRNIHQDAGGPDKGQRGQVDRILRSSAFQSAPNLRKLLEFLATRGTESEAADPTEHLIAAKVFGRSNLDPSADTTVRTAVYRLRQKLGQYYASEGKEDKMLIRIPKGRYSIEFAERGPAVSTPSIEELNAFPESSADGAAIRELSHGEHLEYAPAPAVQPASTLLLKCFAAILLAGGIAIGWGLHSVAASASRHETALISFWRNFAGSDRTILLTFSNVEMLHTETGDLLKFEGAVGARGAGVERSVAEGGVSSPTLLGTHSFIYENGYTGTGEIHAVYQLTRLLSTSGVDVQVKRSQLIDNYDLKNRDVVLLGAGNENPAVGDAHLKQGYVMETPRHVLWGNCIRDLKGALPGGIAMYKVIRDQKSGVLKTDYALFSVTPGPAPNRKIMFLAGLTTSGTEGAAECAASEECTSSLLAHLAAAAHTQVTALPPYFESIVEVHVARGLDPVIIRCVAARAIE